MRRLAGRNIGITVFAMAFVLLGGSLFVRGALAASGQLYLSPAAASVQVGSGISVNVRINPATATDTVNVKVTYDPAKLRYVSTDYSGSPYNTQVGASTTSNSVSFTSTELSGTPVSTDSQVARLSFTALAGSGSSSLTLSGNAANAGTATNPGVAGATISFTSPPATCPAGQTGTPPNCTTPPSGGGTGTGSSPKPVTPKSPTSGTGSGTASGTSAGGLGTTSTTQSTAAGTPPKITGKTVQYTQAALSFTSSVPTQAYIRYGLDGQLTATTPVSPLATSHTIALDPTLLLPGEHYSYVVVTTDQTGKVSQTAVQTFDTKGLKVTVAVFDHNHKPLRNKTVTLHSTPITGKTDDNGFVTFDNVAAGAHHVLYTAGKKTYDQSVSVANTVQTAGTTQTAAEQNFSVVYGLTQSSWSGTWIWLCAAVLILAAIVVLAQTGRLGIALRFRNDNSALLVSQPIIVGGNAPRPAPSGGTDASSKSGKDLTQRLSSLSPPNQPQPGTTVTPRSDRSELTDHQTPRER